MLSAKMPLRNQDLPKPGEPKAQCGLRDMVESGLGSNPDLVTQWLSKLRLVTSPL